MSLTQPLIGYKNAIERWYDHPPKSRHRADPRVDPARRARPRRTHHRGGAGGAARHVAHASARGAARFVREGLLTPSETRGYYVRAFSQQDVIDAIDLRGVLEGMAARLVAERGAPPSLLRDLQSCVEEGDRIFTKNSFADGDEETFAAMNTRFHALIVAAANSRV